MTKAGRRIPRKHLIYFSEVHDKDNAEFSGHLVDISRTGLMTISDKPVDIGKEFRLDIVLPEETEGHDRVHCKAKSIWCKKDVNPDYYATGFEMEPVDIIDEELIEYLIYEYGFNE